MSQQSEQTPPSSYTITSLDDVTRLLNACPGTYEYVDRLVVDVRALLQYESPPRATFEKTLAALPHVSYVYFNGPPLSLMEAAPILKGEDTEETSRGTLVPVRLPAEAAQNEWRELRVGLYEAYALCTCTPVPPCVGMLIMAIPSIPLHQLSSTTKHFKHVINCMKPYSLVVQMDCIVTVAAMPTEHNNPPTEGSVLIMRHRQIESIMSIAPLAPEVKSLNDMIVSQMA